MKDYAKINTAEPQTTLCSMILEGIGFVLVLFMVLALLAILSVL